MTFNRLFVPSFQCLKYSEDESANVLKIFFLNVFLNISSMQGP